MARRRAKTNSAPQPATPAQRSDTSVERPAVWQDRALVVVVALVASIAGIANDFVFDDVPQVVDNVRVHGLSRIGEILTSPYWPPPYAPELFRPVASIGVALQYVIGGGGPLVFRIVSYALYAVVAVGVLSLATRVLPRSIALGVAVVFAAHPLHVEAVALAVNQGELIVGLTAVVGSIRYLDRRRTGLLSSGDWSTLCALFVVAALSKENGFVVPGSWIAAELLLIDAPSFSDRVRDTWRGFTAIAGVGVVMLIARALVLSGSVTGALPAKAIAGLSTTRRLLTMLQIVPRWLRLFAWPAHLQIDYAPNEIVASTHFGANELFGVILLVAFAILAWQSRRRAPVVAFGIFWCAIALFPVSNIVPTGIVLAERTLFLPSIGFLIACGGAVALALKQLSMQPASSIINKALAGACAVLACIGIVRSDVRHRTWSNGQTMWEAAAIDAPKSLRVIQAHNEAVADITHDFQRAAQQSPTPWRVEFELGTLLRYMRADSAALTELRKSVDERPDQHDAALELSATLISVGKYAEAREVAERIKADGDTARVAREFIRMADSAANADAPPGSIRVMAREEFVAPVHNGPELRD